MFDRQLRLLVLDAVERIEIAIRVGWAHHMAIAYGAHGYLDQHHYAHIARHAKALADLSKEFKRSRDSFAEHYRGKYTSPALPPVWMAAEVMSFGLLSKFLGDIKRRADRQAIAKPFGLDEKELTSFVHHMSHVRNICAHHGRLWNRRFTIRMIVPRSPAHLAMAMRGADDHKLHNTMVMLGHLLGIVTPETEWHSRILNLIDDCPLAAPTSMGFSLDWLAHQAWQRVAT